MDPQQELFIMLKLAFERLGFAVYDGALPAAGTPYPFVYLGECQLSDQFTKGTVMGEVTQTVHVWHDRPGQRGTVSGMMLKLKAAARLLEQGRVFDWMLTGVQQQILQDTSTRVPLLHGVLDLNYRFC